MEIISKIESTIKRVRYDLKYEGNSYVFIKEDEAGLFGECILLDKYKNRVYGEIFSKIQCLIDP